uniref:Uncharacterized protein n=1 Tax=Catharus ustulatus TaxID=91951 RepID=A0A8C3VEL7_CATUS
MPILVTIGHFSTQVSHLQAQGTVVWLLGCTCLAVSTGRAVLATLQRPLPLLTMFFRLSLPLSLPTNFDKKVLIWSGRFKKEEDIPRHISSEVLDTARNIVRIKICYIMIALSVLGCVTMIITGKEAVKKDQTLLRMNAEKKAKWRAEVMKGQEAAVGKSQ